MKIYSVKIKYHLDFSCIDFDVLARYVTKGNNDVLLMTFLRKIFSFVVSIFPFFISFTYSQQWEHLGLAGERIETIVIDKTDTKIIYAGSTSDFSEGKAGNLFKTTNGGISWDTLVKNITVTDININPINPNIIFVVGGTNGLTSSKILKSTDKGQQWAKADSGITKSIDSGPYCIEFDEFRPDTLYAGTGFFGGALYKSINGGKSWTKITGPLEFGNGITAISVDPNNSDNVFVATNGNVFLFLSTDNGSTWVRKGTNDRLIFSIKNSKKGRMYVGTSFPSNYSVGLYFSDDQFTTWNNLNPGFKGSVQIEKILPVSDTLYIVGHNVLARIVKDSIFEEINTGDLRCFEIGIGNNSMYIGTLNGIYKRSIITNIRGVNYTPVLNALFQNFPNPFNPTTEIVYEISKPSTVLLEIFNSMGQLIERFVKNHSEAGKYSFAWNASTKPSGVYFVRMQAGSFSSAKKMVLMK